MTRWVRRILLGLAVLAAGLLVVAGIFLEGRFAAGKIAAEREWLAESYPRLTDLGSTRTLAITPLVDWYAARPELRGEPGVAYLVETDTTTILFDVGANVGDLDPSPLDANMRQLGIPLARIDALVLSHAHVDHLGGARFARRGTFSLGREQGDLGGRKVFAPVPMSHPSATMVTARAPTVIAPGLATTGTIPAQLYLGPVEEQALAIRVEGKGLVLVVGCGHQTVPKLLARAAQLFDERVYGVIGGLHYPVPRGRWRAAGVDLQRLVAFGPLRGPSEADLERDVSLLAGSSPGWVSVSAHDSSDEAIGAFRRAFGERYHELRVGERQVIAGDPRPAGHGR